MFDYWNVGVQREVRLLFCFRCYQNRNDIKVMKFDCNIEENIQKSKYGSLRVRKGQILWGKRKEVKYSILSDQRERKIKRGYFRKIREERFLRKISD